MTARSGPECSVECPFDQHFGIAPSVVDESHLFHMFGVGLQRYVGMRGSDTRATIRPAGAGRYFGENQG